MRLLVEKNTAIPHIRDQGGVEDIICSFSSPEKDRGSFKEIRKNLPLNRQRKSPGCVTTVGG
jgi:hypothetical protein